MLSGMFGNIDTCVSGTEAKRLSLMHQSGSLMLMARFVKELVRSGLARARTGTSTTTRTRRIAERFFFDLNSATTQQKKKNKENLVPRFKLAKMMSSASSSSSCTREEVVEYELRRYGAEGVGIGVITLSAPDRMNAFDAKMANQFKTLVHRLEREVLGSTPKSEAPRALVLRGRGPAFCAGGDLGLLGEIARSDDLEGNARRLTDLYASFLSIRRLKVKPQTRNQASSVAASAILVANVRALLTRHQTTVSLSDP